MIDEFRGYKIFLNNTYPSIWLPEHIQADIQGRVYIHRLIMSEHLGRQLSPDELVHHKDENKWNWDIENLELTNHVEHGKHHRRINGFNGLDEKQCEYCNEIFIPSQGKIRYCTPKCSQLSKRKFTIDKEVLEKMIWKIPTIEIAKMFNVSDKAISKRCKLLGIEKPPRGYWAKKYANKL
jgi:hypothetical protein